MPGLPELIMSCIHANLQRVRHWALLFEPCISIASPKWPFLSICWSHQKKVTWFNLSWKCSCENKTLNWKIVKTPNRDSNLWMVNPLFVRKTLNYLKVFIRLKKSPTSCDICNDLSLPEFATKNPNKKTYQKRQVGGLNQPLWKICNRQNGWKSSPKVRGENKQHLSCHHPVDVFLRYVIIWPKNKMSRWFFIGPSQKIGPRLLANGKNVGFLREC